MITVQQKRRTANGTWILEGKNTLKGIPQLVFVFGTGSLVRQEEVFAEVKSMYPTSQLILCSTAGEILDTKVSDGEISLIALSFESTSVHIVSASITDPQESEKVGSELGKELPQKNLVHVMVFSDGLHVNGTALVRGISSAIPASVSVTGGLVGDGSDFKHTYVGFNAPGDEKKIVLVGFYSSTLRVGYGSFGGWDPFGPERKITRSQGNTLYELDGKSALKLYTEYLGDRAKDLPSSGLLFPLSLRITTPQGDVEVVRTVLSVDEENGSMTFAGDMPEGVPAKLMKANFERLIDGASNAASLSLTSIKEKKPEVAILVSCIGRKLVLKERTEEELEAVRELMPDTALAGFYSYGEICPTAPTEMQCQLHNQTMTITLMTE